MRAEEVRVGMVFRDREARRPGLKLVVALGCNVQLENLVTRRHTQVGIDRLVSDYKLVEMMKEESNGQV